MYVHTHLLTYVSSCLPHNVAYLKVLKEHFLGYKSTDCCSPLTNMKVLKKKKIR